MDKIELRKIIKRKRAELFSNGDIDIISKNIVLKILKSEIFKKSKEIALYYPLDGEIDLRGLFVREDKNFYLPKCVDNELFFAKYEGETKLKKACFSTLEPEGGIIRPEIIDIIYIPCLCANNKCYRLGYGKGFYDKFFKKYNLKAKKYIICPSCFITDDLIEDSFDYKCDEIISECT